MKIERVADSFRLGGAGQIEMSDLPPSMDPGIGPAGPIDPQLLAAETEDRLFEGGLNRRAVVLVLPADKAAAVIFHRDAIARHDVQSGTGRTVPGGIGLPRK